MQRSCELFQVLELSDAASGEEMQIPNILRREQAGLEDPTELQAV